jgi:hypothetical protein
VLMSGGKAGHIATVRLAFTGRCCNTICWSGWAPHSAAGGRAGCIPCAETAAGAASATTFLNETVEETAICADSQGCSRSVVVGTLPTLTQLLFPRLMGEGGDLQPALLSA